MEAAKETKFGRKVVKEMRIPDRIHA